MEANLPNLHELGIEMAMCSSFLIHLSDIFRVLMPIILKDSCGNVNIHLLIEVCIIMFDLRFRGRTS